MASIARRNNNAGSFFGIQDFELYDDGEEDDVPAENCGLEVYFSPEMVAHLKKVLKNDKKAMEKLKSIKGVTLDEIKKSNANKVEKVEKVENVKSPSDYPMPVTPESTTPSDDSEKGKNSTVWKFQNISTTFFLF